MSVEQRIVVTVTRADMFLTSHWPVLLIAAGFCLVILFFIWNKGSVQLEEVDDDLNDLEDTN